MMRCFPGGYYNLAAIGLALSLLPNALNLGNIANRA